MISSFELGILHHAIDYTQITLIPKVVNADRIYMFGPASCCIVMYKIISKTLTHGLRPIMEHLVDLL